MPPAPERSARRSPSRGGLQAPYAPGPRAGTPDRREGLSRGLGEPGAGRGRHGAPGKGAGKGAPSRSPSLAGIEGSGLREETSPELRRGELKERRGGGEDGGGKNRSWSPSRSGPQDRSPRPPPPSPRAPPARPAVSPRAPPRSPARSLTPPLSLRLSVSGLVSAHLHSCPGIARTAGIPLSQIQKGSLALYIPEEPSPFPSRSLLLPHRKTTPLLLGGLESIIITLKTPALYGERAVVCLDYLCEVGGAELKDPHCSDEETEAPGSPVTCPRSHRESGMKLKPNPNC